MSRNNSYPIFKSRLKHTFHLVDNSPLPICTANLVGALALQLVYYFQGYHSIYLTLLILFFFSISLLLWFLSVIEESGHGYHSWSVYTGLRYGMALFIVSEVAFFFAFFWAFFHVSLAPAIAIGAIWPPRSIQPLEIWGLPLTNTLLLLSSGLTLTLAHYDLMNTNKTPRGVTVHHLIITIFLGMAFLYCQFIEYKFGITFSWKENVYGSTFFVTTGFHGFHVIIGTIFLLFCCVRMIITNKVFAARYLLYGINNSLMGYLESDEFLKLRNASLNNQGKLWHLTLLGRLVVWYDKNRERIMKLINFKMYEFTKKQHLGFEAAAWYWHFVDVVWIFLFLTIYWWGSN